MDKRNTRQVIVETSAGLIHGKGFNNTGLNEILRIASVPKGSFYYFFKSKEELGLSVLEYFTHIVDSFFMRFLLDETVAPLQRIENLINFYIGSLEKSRFRLGCPIGNLSLEMSDLSDDLRRKLQESIGLLISRIKFCLSEAQKTGDLSGKMDLYETASFIFYGVEGSIMHTKVLKKAEPIEIFRKSIMTYLRGHE